MAFQVADVSKLLAECRRHCCICHRFCGVKIETDHIVPAAEGGNDDIQNAIPVCFECHAEIHSYNDKHPRGRKFRPEELRLHKNQWLEICRTQPERLLGPLRDTSVGPLQALIDELDFNRFVVKGSSADSVGCRFHDEQFRRAIHEGAISILEPDLKAAVMQAYLMTGLANELIGHAFDHPGVHGNGLEYRRSASGAVVSATDFVETAYNKLLGYLSAER